jgi:hypothetical protein
MAQDFADKEIEVNTSHLATIETPTNHNFSQQEIVFAIIEKYLGIVLGFPFSKKEGSH